MYMAKVEKMQIGLEAFKVALLQDNTRVVEEITNNVEMSFHIEKSVLSQILAKSEFTIGKGSIE